MKEYNVCLLMNPTMIFANLLGQMVNDILPSGVVLISLGVFVVAGIVVNVVHCVKKYQAESKQFALEKKQKELEKAQKGEELSIKIKEKGEEKTGKLEIDMEREMVTRTNNEPIPNKVPKTSVKTILNSQIDVEEKELRNSENELEKQPDQGELTPIDQPNSNGFTREKDIEGGKIIVQNGESPSNGTKTGFQTPNIVSKFELPHDENDKEGNIEKGIKDNQHKESQHKNNIGNNIKTQENLIPIPSNSQSKVIPSNSTKTNTSKKGIFSIEKIKMYENRHLHPIKSPLFITSLGLVILNSFMKGSSSVPSIVGLDKCEWPQFLILGLVCTALSAIFAVSVWVVYKEQKVKLTHRHHSPHEILFSPGKIFALALSGLIIGFVSNILGVGGAVAMFPMMTCLGIDPFVASSSVMFMILLSKTIASVLALNSGFLSFQYVLLNAFLMTISILVLLKVLDNFLKRFRRQSIIIMAMILVLIFSLIFIPYYAVRQSKSSPHFWKFSAYCPNS